ncbi:hypothetical protein ACWGJB_45485 [Streptomyces sp. NPDC054813]
MPRDDRITPTDARANVHPTHTPPRTQCSWQLGHPVGYGGEEFSTWAQDTLGITIKVVPRPKDAKGFVLLPKRRVVERSDSWTMRARRNARDYELLMSHAEAHIQWAFITLMSRRLARPRRQNEAPPVTLAAA